MQDFEDMSGLLRRSKKLFLQKFRNGHTLNKEYTKYRAFNDEEMESLVDLFKKNVQEVYYR